MASQKTYLCIVNESELDITDTYVDQVDNYDWDGDSRPDHNFQGVSIANHDSLCEREELNAYANSAWYRMKLMFRNGDWLRFRNDQYEAETKHNRIFKNEESASADFVVYQTSGADMNAMYIRDKTPPDNSGWMSALLSQKSSIRLDEITMPGSHDAGMYTTTKCVSPCLEGSWAKTQGESLLKQLIAGSRYFDLRIYYDGKDYRVGHFSSFGGCYGPLFSEVLDDVATFMKSYAGNSEVVILNFSHTMSSSPYDYSKDLVVDHIVNEIANKNIFGEAHYTSDDPKIKLAETYLSELSGKVITVFGNEFAHHYNAGNGIFPCYNLPSNNGSSGTDKDGLLIYDHYSDTDSFEKMRNEQQDQLQKYGGYGNGHQFLLSWTLTQKGISLLDIQCLSILANPRLPHFLSEVLNGNLKQPNVVYFDFVDAYLCRDIINVNYL